MAGNALDGEFYGPQSASGDGVPGGDFIANIAAFHNTTFSPGTVIGTVTPNDPGGIQATPWGGPRRPVKKTKPVVANHHTARHLVRVEVTGQTQACGGPGPRL